MIEALVLSLCLGGYECNTALKAAYTSNVGYKQAARQLKTKAERVVGRPTIVAVPAIAAVVSQKTINLRLTKNLTTVSNPDTIKLIYGFTF